MSHKVRVLFLHGFMGSALNWGRIRNLLEAKGINTFAIDLLGHALNHAQKPLNISAHEALTQDLIVQCAAFNPTHIVAHSFSLRPCLLMALKRPDLIPHLVVEDSSPELSPSAHSFLMSVINAPVPFRTRELARDYFDNRYGPQSALSRFFMSNIRSTSEGLADWRFDRSFLEMLLNEALAQNLWKEWSAFPNKVDLIYGVNSEALNSSTIDEMKKQQKDLGLYPIENAAHWVHSDQADAFANTVAKIVGV